MLEKMNIIDILSDHFDTLRRHDTGRRSKGDILTLFVAPILLATILVYLGVLLNSNIVNVMITSFSIFAALLLNLLLLIYSIVERKHTNSSANDQTHDPRAALRTKFIQEVYANISFEILLSILLIVILVVATFGLQNLMIPSVSRYTIRIGSALVFTLVFMFIGTLIMILKRIHRLLSNELK